MSVLNQSGEELVECPLCMEPLEVDDLHFYPCTCGYQICRFCWNRIREGENGLCPACRKAYPENPADFTPLSQEQVAAIKTEKKAREQKRRNKTLESRRALANVRVVQNNLVFVVGLPVRLADPEILKRQEYFGKYGKIHKVVINQSTSYAGSQGPSASAYVTYVSPADALRAIQGVNNVTLDGRVLKGSLGTTKYCANFMKNQPCPKPDCMYLHELGDPKASFTKEEMHAGLHQVYERKLHNQLLQAQKDKPEEKHTNGSGNSSTNAEKSSSKDGNQSNFIPTTVVTSSHINIVNSSKSKKEQNGSNSNGSSGSSSGSSNGKEAWPSLGSSPPSDSPARKQPSPKPLHSTVKSQENGMSSTSESSSPTQLQSQQQAQNKSKDTQHTDKNRNKDTTTNGQSSKKKNKQKTNNSISIDNEDTTTTKHNNDDYNNSEQDKTNTQQSHTNNTSVFDSETQNYLTNELDELESDRHSLLENHDLLDNSDHSLLEDDNTHNLLNDTTKNEVLLMQRHRDMLAGLVDNSTRLLPHMKSPILNGYGLLDREVGYSGLDRHISQISQGIMEQKDMLMRPNEMMARHNVMVEPKHYIPSSSIGLESASELLGATFHQNPNMLPPFGMRVDNSIGTSSMGGSSITNNMSGNMSNNMPGNMSNNMSGNIAANALNSGYLLHNQQMLQNQQQMQSGMVNGYDTPQSTNEGRYLAENMDKFFTDFHKAQQLRQQHTRGVEPRYRSTDSQLHHYPQNMLSAERLEMEHKQRLSTVRATAGAGAGARGEGGAGRCAAGDGDDDLDFDPFKETQKAFAELMENEMMHNQISSGDNVRRTRMAPPGFSHVTSSFGLAAAAAAAAAAAPRHLNHHQGYVNSNSSSSALFSDWSQMDPAIMSVNFSKGGAGVPAAQHQDLFARFNQLGVAGAASKGSPVGPGAGSGPWPAHQHKLAWTAPQYSGIPLPPGFAPTKPHQPTHSAECIDAK